MERKSNTLVIKKEAFNHFEQDYINTMINQFEEDTKWMSIKNRKERIKNLNLGESDKEKEFQEHYKFIKKSMESASYKAGYEILKSKNVEENPYEYIEKIKSEKDKEEKRNLTIKLIEHIENNKETYCMKDIIYTKINCFWENVAFLNRNSNKKDIKEEYKNVFVTPFIEYINNTRKSDYSCIECGNTISKKEASGMSWLKDVGVDINRKKSGFWNFNEDTYICPICNLIYSCVPLGFTMVGSNGIFVNNNESMKELCQDNTLMKVEEEIKEDIFENTYQKILYNYINRTEQITNEKRTKYEPKNIQVVKRIGAKDNQKYEFNVLSKDKLSILGKTINQFKGLIGTSFYQEALSNLIEGRKQYRLIDRILRENKKNNKIENILIIQLNSIGGIDVKERKQRIDEMIEEGEKIQKHFFYEKENQNKIKSYVYKLQGALKSNNIEEFLKLFTLFYGSMGRPMPNCEAVTMLIQEPEYFRLLGYSYVYGLQKRVDKKVNNEGGNENEE